MIAYLKYKRKLHKLYRNRQKCYEEFEDEIKKATKNQMHSDDIHQLNSEARFEDQQYHELIGMFITDYLRGKAAKLFVPFPNFKDKEYWEQCEYLSNRYILTQKGIHRVIVAIRKERKESVELFLMIIASLTGLIGAIIGVVSVLK